MKHSVSAVSTKVGDISEVIESGVDGILFKSQGSKYLCNAIESLITNKDKYKQIAHNMRKKILEHFNQSNWIKEIENVYKNFIHYREEDQSHAKAKSRNSRMWVNIPLPL